MLTGGHFGSRDNGLGDDEAKLNKTASPSREQYRTSVDLGRTRCFVNGIHECRPNDDKDRCSNVPRRVVTFLNP